jgi:hypothetical protein
MAAVGVRALADLAHRGGAVAARQVSSPAAGAFARADGRDVVVGNGGAHGFEHQFDSVILNPCFNP